MYCSNVPSCAGAEALFADLGHFSMRSIQVSPMCNLSFVLMYAVPDAFPACMQIVLNTLAVRLLLVLVISASSCDATVSIICS